MSRDKVLQPVDVNVERSPARKRSRLDSSANGESSAEKAENDDKDLDMGVGRLDNPSDQACSEEDSIFSRNGAIDVSCASMTPTTRREQLTLLESTLTKPTLSKLSSGELDSMLVAKPAIKPTEEINYFQKLSDEIILHIFKWLPRIHLKEISVVCKKFYQLTSDETLWTRMDLCNRYIPPGELGGILSKQVVVLKLSRSEVADPPLERGRTFERICSSLMFVDMSMTTISLPTLEFFISTCRRLRKISLENVTVSDKVLTSLSANKNLEVLNLPLVTGITIVGLRNLILNCKKIQELNIAWTSLTAESISYICENLSSTVIGLNISGCNNLLTDTNVERLIRSCPHLKHLELSDSVQLTDRSIFQILALKDLISLGLSRCYLLTYDSLLLLRELKNLRNLNIFEVFRYAFCYFTLQSSLQVPINVNIASEIARPAKSEARTSYIWNINLYD